MYFQSQRIRKRIISNFDVFDFELSEDDMNAINKLNKNEKHGSDPETFNFKRDLAFESV